MLSACPESILFFFFFFQAEDGIRDKLVTGVQTCALPIYLDQVAQLEEHRLPDRPVLLPLPDRQPGLRRAASLPLREGEEGVRAVSDRRPRPSLDGAERVAGEPVLPRQAPGLGDALHARRLHLLP